MNPLQPIVDLFDGLRDGIYFGPQVIPDDVREAILDGYRKTFAADFERACPDGFPIRDGEDLDWLKTVPEFDD